MRRILIALLVFLPVSAGAVIAVRQHADSILPGRKILAQDLNDEFDELVNAVNSIDSSNVTNGSLDSSTFAATSSALTLNKKMGCRIGAAGDFTGTKLVSIFPPCEIFMDGNRGFITATQDISILNDLSDGSLGFSQYYYIYASRDGVSLSFNFSQVAPSLATTRKSDDTTKKYIGTMRTCDATLDFVRIRQITSNQFVWTQSALCAVEDGLIATGDASSVTPSSLSVPNTFDKAMFQYTILGSGAAPKQCSIDYDQTTYLPYQAVAIATSGSVGIVPLWLAPSLSTLRVSDVSGCASGASLKIIGWSEPPSLHQ